MTRDRLGQSALDLCIFSIIFDGMVSQSGWSMLTAVRQGTCGAGGSVHPAGSLCCFVPATFCEIFMEVAGQARAGGESRFGGFVAPCVGCVSPRKTPSTWSWIELI